MENYYVKPYQTTTEEELGLYNHYQQTALSHWLYRFIPRHRSQIYWYDFGHWISWALFGNDDHGIFSEGASSLI